MAETDYDTNTVELATELTIAWLSNPNTRATAEEVPSFLRTMHDAVSGLSGSEDAPAAVEEEHVPAVSARKSLASKDHILSMIDGKPYKTLRRHLATHGLSPEQYRERYNLKPDYPMVAESYSAHRREMAKQIGLGRKPGQRRGQAASSEEGEAQAPKRRGRPKAEG